MDGEQKNMVRPCGGAWTYGDGDCKSCPAGRILATDRTEEQNHVQMDMDER